MTWTRSRKWKAAAVAAVVAVLAAATAGRLLAARRLMETVRSECARRWGLDVRAEGVGLSVIGGTAVFEGVRVLDGAATLLEVGRITVDARVLDLLRGRLDFARVTVVHPVLRIVVEEDGGTNLRRVRARAMAVVAGPGPEGPGVLRLGTVVDGRIEFLDAVTDPGNPLRVEVGNLRGTVAEWRISGLPASLSSSDFRFDGEIEQEDLPARISVVAWCAPPGDPPAGTLLATVTGLDLRGIPQYVGAADRAALGGDFLHAAADIRWRGDAIGPGGIAGEVAGAGTVLPMRVGGTLDEPVFDTESPLALLLRIPLSRIGSMGAVTLDAAWSVIRGGGNAVADVAGGVADAGASLGSGLLGAGGELLEGDPLGALGDAGGGILGVATSIGGGLLDGAASLFGGGSDALEAVVGEDAAQLRVRFERRHAAGRLAMLRASLASAVGGGAGERRARIRGEIGVSPGLPSRP